MMILTYLDRSKRLFQYVTNVRSDRGVCGVLFPDIGGGSSGVRCTLAARPCQLWARASALQRPSGHRQGPGRASALWSPAPAQAEDKGGRGRGEPLESKVASPQRAPPAGRSPGQSSRLSPSRARGAGPTSWGPVWLQNRLLAAGRRVAVPGPAEGLTAAAQGSAESVASALTGTANYASVRSFRK